MQYKTNNSQPRFFCLKVSDLTEINVPQFNSKQEKHKDHEKAQKKFKIIFQIGSKKSQSQFKAYKSDKNYDNFNVNLSTVRQQMHIIPYQYEEVMSVKLILQGKQERFGYSLMPLNPLIKMPHTCHQIELNLVFQTQKKQIINRKAAVLTVQFYYLLKFQGILFIQPIQAHLTKNEANLGQMKPSIKLRVNEKVLQTKTIDQGGIHPVWKQKMSKQHQLYMFRIQSAASQLQLTVQHTSSIGNSLNQVGKANVKIQDKQIFKNSKSISKIVRCFLKDANKDQKIKKNLNRQEKLKLQQKVYDISSQFQKLLQTVLEEGNYIKIEDFKQKNKNKSKKQNEQAKDQLKIFKSYFLQEMLELVQIQLVSYDHQLDQQYKAGVLTTKMGFIYAFQLDQSDTIKKQSPKRLQESQSS